MPRTDAARRGKTYRSHRADADLALQVETAAVELDEATHLMEEQGLARLPVFERGDHLAGMLSIKDVSTHWSHEFSGGPLEAVAKHRH